MEVKEDTYIEIVTETLLEAGYVVNTPERDIIMYDAEKEGLVWIYALTDYMDAEGYEVFDFEGGYYVTYHYKDGDHEENK